MLTNLYQVSENELRYSESKTQPRDRNISGKPKKFRNFFLFVTSAAEKHQNLEVGVEYFRVTGIR
jgi:hypothetical protein